MNIMSGFVDVISFKTMLITSKISNYNNLKYMIIVISINNFQKNGDNFKQWYIQK